MHLVMFRCKFREKSTLYTKLSLILSLYNVSSFVPKILVEKTDDGELSITLLFKSADYRSSASCSPDGTPVLSKPEESRKSDFQIASDPTMNTPMKTSPAKTTPMKTTTKQQSTKNSDLDSQCVKPKYKSPSKLKRDRTRLLAYRKRWSNRSEPQSKGTNSSSCTTNLRLVSQHSSIGYTENTADLVPNMINELIYEPTKFVIFVIYMVVGLVLLLYDT